MERLDKIIATALQISRKDAIALIKRGRIAVSKETIKDPKAKFDENGAVLFCDNEQIYYNKYVYIMMNTQGCDFSFKRKRRKDGC